MELAKAIDFLIEKDITGIEKERDAFEWEMQNHVKDLEDPVTENCPTCKQKWPPGLLKTFVEGREVRLGASNSIDNDKTSIGIIDTNIVTIRNKVEYQGKANRTEVNMNFAGAAVDGTKPVVIKIIKNATVAGSPTFSDLATETSVIDFDTAGTTVTNGQTIFTLSAPKDGAESIDLVAQNVILIPGDTLTLAVRTTLGTTDVDGSMSWIERF